MENYSEGCKGCVISRGVDTKVNDRGGIVGLNGNWTLNHYFEGRQRISNEHLCRQRRCSPTGGYALHPSADGNE